MSGLKWVAAWLLVSVSVPAWAQGSSNTVWEEYDKLINGRSTVAAFGPDLLGDSVDLASGALSFSATDVSVPGNSALPVAFTRRLKVHNRGSDFRNDLPLADWDLDIPRITGVFATTWHSQRCTGTGPPPTIPIGLLAIVAEKYWQGNHADMPGGGELLAINASAPKPSSGGPYRWVTSGRTHFSCLPNILNGPGEGFLAVTADGTKYWFNHMAQYYEAVLEDSDEHGNSEDLARRRNALYVSRVEDRFGNWVTYSYNNNFDQPVRLEVINSNDQRTITLHYNGNGHISQVKEGAREWNYGYTYPDPWRGTLTSVTLPDTNMKWEITLSALSSASIEYNKSKDPQDFHRNCYIAGDITNKLDQPIGTIKHPSGAVGAFTVAIERLGRSNVPAVCYNYTQPSNDPNDDVAKYPISWDAFTLSKKQISGPGLATAIWTYTYSSFISHFFPYYTNIPVCPIGDCSPPNCTDDSCAKTTKTTVVGPESTWTRYTFGNSYRYNEGKLLLIEQGSSEANILKTVTNTYNLAQSGQPYVTQIGSTPQQRGDGFTSEFVLPQVSSVTAQDGATFGSYVQTGCTASGVYCFNEFAQPTNVTKSSSLGDSRTESTAYLNDLSKWVLGQVTTVTKTNPAPSVVMSQTDYDANVLPWKTYAFGKLQQTITYNADGTLATIKDGNNHITSLFTWKRGTPQLIQHPATPDSPSGATESAQVNDFGWIDWVVDETGAKTCYLYDVMGRLTTITYPSETTSGECDASAWSITNQNFDPVDAAEYGIPGIHWKQVVSTGNARTVRYFDALWRPLVEESFDNANKAATLTQVVRRYDLQGRTVFQSYPINNLSNYATVSQGVRNTYDSLDRLIQVSQDSEHGPLLTDTDYLAGFQTKVKNPRGFETTTSYQAFDAPTTEAPKAISSPGSVMTTISRDVYGKPLSVTRTGPGT